MDSYRWLLLVVGSFTLAGCHGGVDTDVLERELRGQEDRIYALEDKIDEYRAALDSCRRNSQALRRRLESGDADYFGAGDQEPMSLEPPPVELGTPADPEADAAPDGNGALPAPGDGRAGDSDLGILDGPVETIVLSSLLTGGLNIDSRPGDDGITVVIEPRDGSGHVVSATGQVSLMIVDPARTGPGAQVARWDFNEEEVAGRWRSSALAEGLYFELPWPAVAPASGRLKLWARLVTSDGRKFLTSAEIDIEGSSRSTQASSPSAAGSQGPSGSVAAPSVRDRWNQRWAGVERARTVAPTRSASAVDRRTLAPRSDAAGRSVEPVASRPEWRPFR